MHFFNHPNKQNVHLRIAVGKASAQEASASLKFHMLYNGINELHPGSLQRCHPAKPGSKTSTSWNIWKPFQSICQSSKRSRMKAMWSHAHFSLWTVESHWIQKTAFLYATWCNYHRMFVLSKSFLMPNLLGAHAPVWWYRNTSHLLLHPLLLPWDSRPTKPFETISYIRAQQLLKIQTNFSMDLESRTKVMKSGIFGMVC